MMKFFGFPFLLLLYLLFVFSSFSAKSQQLIITEKSYNYPFVLNSQTATNVFANRVLQKLSIYQDINISFSIDLFVKVTQLSQYQYVALAEVHYNQCKGSYFYRDFDLCQDFFPEFLDFAFEVNQQSKLKSQIEISFKNRPHETIQKILTWTDSTGNNIPEIKPIFKNIRYDEHWEQKIIKKINRIELFHISDSLINHWNEKLDKIKLENTELIPIFDFTLDEIEKDFEFFNDQNVYTVLNFSNISHQSYASKISELNQKISQKRYLTNEYLHLIDFRFIESAREALRLSNLENAIYFYKKSLEFHPYNIVALKELGQLYLNQERLSEASELIKIIFSKTWPQGQIYTESLQLAKDVFQAILKTGDKWIKEEEFHRAIESYSLALIFCDSIRESLCNQSHKLGIVNAKKGILNSYFNVINKSLERNRLDIAENYVRESKKYQLANLNELPNDQEIQAMADKVVTRYVNEAMINIQNAHYHKAIQQLDRADSLGFTFRENFSLAYLDESRKKAYTGAFSEALLQSKKQLEMGSVFLADSKHQEAMSFYQQHPEWIRDTTIAYALFVAIRRAESVKKTDWGNVLFAKSEYSAALKSLQDAKSLEQFYKLPENSLLDSLLFAISQPIAFEKLNSVAMKIWRNELMEAKSIIDEVQILIKKSNLENNESLMQLFNSTVANFESQKCLFANSEISRLKNEFDIFKRENAFISAKLAVENILEIQKKFSECITNIYDYDAVLRFLIPASEYENLIRESSIEFRLENYSLAIQIFFDADSLYLQSNLENQGVKKTNISSFFYQSTNFQPIFSTLKTLSIYQKPDCVFELLHLLKKKGVKSSQTRLFQKQLATLLQKNDKQNFPHLSKRERIKQYPVTEKWFFWFKMYYFSSCKFVHLDKNSIFAK